MTVMPEVHDQLRRAVLARRQTWWQRLRGTRSPLAAVLAAAAICLPATAVIAAVTDWNPSLGGGPNEPSTTDAPPPEVQLASLGVLRRAQTPVDRGPAAENALSYLPQNLSGVRLSYVRVVPVGDGVQPLVLTPVAKTLSASPRSDRVVSPIRANAICMFVAETAPDGGFGDGGGFGCFSDDEIAQGRAIFGIGSRVYALAPDHVTGVTLTGTGTGDPITVRDNVYSYIGSTGETRTYRYDDGHTEVIRRPTTLSPEQLRERQAFCRQYNVCPPGSGTADSRTGAPAPGRAYSPVGRPTSDAQASRLCDPKVPADECERLYRTPRPRPLTREGR